MKLLSQSKDNERKRKEEMLLYKRELFNRDENFNAVFASSVGGISSKFKEQSAIKKETRCTSALMKSEKGRTRGKVRCRRDKTESVLAGKANEG